MIDFYLKAGDLEPAIFVVLTDDEGEPIDLTTATGVTVRAAYEGADVGLFERAGTIDDPATSGRVSYEWQSGDTDESGTLLVEFTVAWDDGTDPDRPQTYPSTRYVKVKIKARLPAP